MSGRIGERGSGYLKTWYLLILIICLVGCGGGGAGFDNGGSDQPQTLAKLSIYALPVGQGDSTFIEMSDGWTILIDGGIGDDVLSELPKVMKSGSRRINQLVLTHPDEDHLHGLLEVLKHYQVDEVWETGVISPSLEYPIWHKLIKDREIVLKKVYAGEIASHGSSNIEVIGPTTSMDRVAMLNPNNSSIVIKLRYGNFDAFFMGDAEIEEQSSIVDKLSQVEYFKVPHHGAKNAAYEPTWERARPEVAVLTVSDLSQYIGLPSAEASTFMKRYAKKVYRTDKNGIITITTDGVTWSDKSEY